MRPLADFCSRVCPFLLLGSFWSVAAAQPVPGGKPVSERTTEIGCWIIAHEPVGRFNESSVFWHLDAYPTRAAAQAAKGAQGAVVQSFGKVSLLTIAEEGWRPQGGERVAQIGPLPVTPGQNYSAQYMEATFTPGMTASEHIHPGPEAWFTLSGETCLETPEGKQVGRAGGQPVIVPGGPPMHLTATGSVSHLMSPLGVERVCFRMARHCNSFKSAFASFRSSVSKPFVNQK